jgi:hypothetical protein
MSKYIVIIAVVFLFISCGKEKSPVPNNNTQTENSQLDEDTSEMSPEEVFSSALVNNILNVDDEDLQVYLEKEFYTALRKCEKVSIDKISSSLYILSYVENGNEKNFLIQKSYNPVTDEFIFDKKETQTNIIKQFIK